jgi:hypothetical protein
LVRLAACGMEAAGAVISLCEKNTETAALRPLGGVPEGTEGWFHGDEGTWGASAVWFTVCISGRSARSGTERGADGRRRGHGSLPGLANTSLVRPGNHCRNMPRFPQRHCNDSVPCGTLQEAATRPWFFSRSRHHSGIANIMPDRSGLLPVIPRLSPSKRRCG